MMRMFGARVGENCRFERIGYRQADEIQIGDFVAICRGTVLYPFGPRTGSPKIVIGNNVFLNWYCFIDAGLRVEIGDNVMIGPFVYITDGNHGTEAGRSAREQPMEWSPVVIKDGAWIGAHACILAGVTVGRNAVVGAGAVVTHDVAEDEIVGGVPARRIGMRKPSRA